MKSHLTLTSTHPHERLLIYFAGWGTTPEVVAHLSLPEGYDYLTCYDYTTLSPTDLPNLSAYREVAVVAWSMGVWAADLLAPYLPSGYGIALGGTPLPMHNDYGIPDTIFRGTLEMLTDETREKFNRRMCGGKSLLTLYNSFAARSTEELKAELLNVHRQVERLPLTPPRLSWRQAIVGERDLIVPPANQLRYWQTYAVSTLTLPGVGHYPFHLYTDWLQLICP